MKPWMILAIVVSGLLLFSVFIAHWELVPSNAATGQPEGQRVPVVVELFTSEGCSSCPPADAALTRLEQSQPVPGAEVIALGQHVDYWNDLGWADPFSSAAFSARQSAYAQAFGRDGVYTPQMVVDGQIEFIGSDLSKARDAIARASRSPKATVEITRAARPSGSTTDVVPLLVRVGHLPALSPGDLPEVLLAITEGNLRSSVSRGENAGHRLSHSAVVRELRAVGRMDPAAAKDFSAETSVTIAGGWHRPHLRAVIFVQERVSRRVLGAAAISLATE